MSLQKILIDRDAIGKICRIKSTQSTIIIIFVSSYIIINIILSLIKAEACIPATKITFFSIQNLLITSHGSFLTEIFTLDFFIFHSFG